MAYQTGTASSPVTLLQTLVTWLISIGWTQNMSQADGLGWRAHLQKSGNYVNFRASMNESAIWAGAQFGASIGLNFYLSSSLASGSAWNNQAGGPIGTGQVYTVGVGAGLPIGAIQNYYFFSDSAGDNVVVVIEATPALYRHIGWGLSLVKVGAWTGGPYFFGSVCGYYVGSGSAGPGTTLTSSCPGCDGDFSGNQNCFIKANVDTFTGLWLGLATANATAPITGGTGKLAASSVAPAYSYALRTLAPRYTDNWFYAPGWQQNQTSGADGRANLLPVHLWAVRDSGALSLIGWIPNVFFTNGVTAGGFSNASEYVLGGITYKMFPNFAVIKQ
jgi:hypothetical protein